jgi:phosphohistidine phosphatase SixA
LLALLSLLSSCASPPIPYTYTVYLSRHFEKQSNVSDPELTAKGNRQAEIFASLLDNKPIQHIYSTNYNRTKSSVKPLAESLNLQIEIYDPRAPSELISRVTSLQQDQVILGHSNTIPDLVGRLGGKAQPISETEYGVIFAVSLTLLEGELQNVRTRKFTLLESR